MYDKPKTMVCGFYCAISLAVRRYPCFTNYSSMSFSLTVIGCGSATPVGHRLSSAFALKHNQHVFLIDCGEGTQVYLKDNHIHMQRIDRIFISHAHGDHFFGLVGLLSSMHIFGRRQALTVYGPPELEHIIRYQLEVGGTVLCYPLHFVATQTETPELLLDTRSEQVYSFPLKHSLPTTGFLFKEKKPADARTSPKSFAYCSDTAYTENILPFIRKADVLYHESTFLESEANLAAERLHSTASQAARIARKAEVGKLLLGHYSARYADTSAFKQEASAIFPETFLAAEGLILNF